MAEVEFQDFSVKVKEAMKDSALRFLEEAASEIEAQAIRNSSFSKTLRGSSGQGWSHNVNESKMEATVGHPMQLAIWLEFGTGEHALKRNGRKGYWVYVKGNSSVSESNPGKARTLAEAQAAVAILRSKGLDAYYTKGQKPHRMLYKAFETKKAAIIKRAKQVFGEGMK